jgi:hypothetical protein
MGLLGALTGGGGGTPKWARKPMLEAFEKARQAASLPFEPYTAPRVAELAPATQMGIQAAIDALRNDTGGGAVNAAIDLARQAGGYAPTMIAPGMVAGAALAPVGDVTAAAIDRRGLGDVAAGLFPGADLSAYMNPYIRQTIEATTADLARQREIQRQADNARAVRAQAFGGSRQAVADAETSIGFNSTLASTVADLYRQGFGQASELWMRDQDRALQAASGNRALDADVATRNAQMAQEAALGNRQSRYDQALQNALFEQRAAEANLGALMESQRLNQQARHDAANLGLGAAQHLGDLGRAQHEMAMGRAQTLTQAGALQQAVEQAKLDAAYEEFERRVGYPAEMARLMMGGGQMISAAKSGTIGGLLSGFQKFGEGYSSMGWGK